MISASRCSSKARTTLEDMHLTANKLPVSVQLALLTEPEAPTPTFSSNK
eukprot:CAMPEP_0115579980 /NCGR_PEP_ID=MMETSP0272-20121206/4382_1 /TAXON_ID=71861 /ORGANISM="Scrippsiella trochoidea, Strain CCMP3099" /LENGTH=48 /DNA_ID=CAMNT_0003014869 /DNA_START=299 /DNA_END=448 /DNA_ORIENTATION=-